MSSDDIGAQLRRRREAADRLPPLPDGRRDPVLDIDERKVTPSGLVRATTSRTVAGRCMICDRRFDNTGGSASHAKGAEHPVAVDYRTTFVYLPPGASAVTS